MARLRKEKGVSSRPATAKDSARNSAPDLVAKKGKAGKKSDAVLREQVLALGGNQDDYDLVKGIDDNLTSGPSNEDVSFYAWEIHWESQSTPAARSINRCLQIPDTTQHYGGTTGRGEGN